MQCRAGYTHSAFYNSSEKNLRFYYIDSDQGDNGGIMESRISAPQRLKQYGAQSIINKD